VLHNSFSSRTDYLDEDLDAFDGAIKIKKSHLQIMGDPRSIHIRPKGECRKVRYRSRKDALQALRTIKYLRARYEEDGYTHLKVERRAYRCYECGGGAGGAGYHLTSQPWSAPRKPAQVIRLTLPLVVGAPREVAHVA
jgi:hypothetical protein